MYVGPWQELRALERAKAAEELHVRHQEQRLVVEELERLRRAIDVVSHELEPVAASKVLWTLECRTRNRVPTGPRSSGAG